MSKVTRNAVAEGDRSPLTLSFVRGYPRMAHVRLPETAFPDPPRSL